MPRVHQQDYEHEKYEELCALSVSGALDAEEWDELRSHLIACVDCRIAYREYLLLAEQGMPALGYAAEGGKTEPAIKDEHVQELPDPQASSGGVQVPLVTRWRIARVPRAALAVAACVLMVLGLAIDHFKLKSATLQQAEADAQHRIQRLTAEKANAENRLESAAQQMSQLEAQTTQQETELQQLRRRIGALQEYSNHVVSEKTTSDQQAASLAQQQDILNARLRDLQQKYDHAQIELINLRAEHDRSMLRLASLQGRVDSVAAQNRDQEKRLHLQEQLLADDRDIRELMGARQLLMADVFDVGTDSRTKKPYGRVFYTKGKSLIFYAFDLDRQPGVKNAAFQAWGRNESSTDEPINLGIFYVDNEANRRWILRFDDPTLLAQIDSVFVTIEPHGGSKKPTGKALLYASLRRAPNHP